MSTRRFWGNFTCAALIVSFTSSTSASEVTFHRDIAPILVEFCSSCHRDGGAGPFPLATYQDARRHASQILAVTQRRYMPPWLPEEGYGDFEGESRLTAAQLKTIADWVVEGAREGDPADSTPKPQFAEGWQFGPPDLIVSIPQPYTVPSGGGDIFRNFVLPVRLTQAKYVRAIELRPGNNRLVHHANIWIDRRRKLQRREGEDGQPGFPGMDVATEARSDSFDPDSHFLFWKPGGVPRPEPDDMSWRLDPETDLILNLHLQPSGKPESIRPLLGLYFSPRPPTRFPMLVQLEHDAALDIPAGAASFTVSDHLRLPIDVEVLAIYPHAHYLGRQVAAWAVLPDGSRQWLIKINNWDINSQAAYTYRRPVFLPKATDIEMRITYDNSAENARNPNRPPIRVRAGARASDEMGHVWLQLLPRMQADGDPRAVLQEAVMNRRLEKYPGDFMAYCNLGALKAMKREYAEAESHFEHALKVQPESATARNGLGASLLAQGRTEEAIRELREALREDSEHRNALWNLSKALLSKGDTVGAAMELQKLVTERPGDADAQLGLGLVYFMQRSYEPALECLGRAARLRPNDAAIRTNLGAVLASRGDLADAAAAFREALRLDPKDRTAQDYLDRAQQAIQKNRR